jgi:hypothetical protein
MILKEIVYRLLTGGQGARLSHLPSYTGDSHRISKAIRYLRERFTCCQMGNKNDHLCWAGYPEDDYDTRDSSRINGNYHGCRGRLFPDAVFKNAVV